MSQLAEQLKRRTMQFALDVCALVCRLPPGDPGLTVKRQLTRAATSVAFNYRATCRARSHAEFTAKLGTVVEEVDEAQGWLEFIEAAGLMRSPTLSRLIREATEITAVMSASVGTARYRERTRRRRRAITQLPDSSSPYPPLILQLEHVRGVQVERRRFADVRAPELGVASIADRDVLEPPVDDEIDERGGCQDPVRDEIAAEPIEGGADQRADD